MLEDKIQNPSKCLFGFSLGGNVIDHRSGDGRFGGRSKIIALNSRLYSFPEFEMLDAGIASPLNKVIQNSYFKKKVSLEEQKTQKEYWFLRGRQIAYMFYDNFTVTGAHDTVLDYADLFTVILRKDDVQEFDTRWDEILLSMSKIPSDDVLESLFKLRTRESDQLKTVQELYDLEIHQKISMPNYQKN